MPNSPHSRRSRACKRVPTRARLVRWEDCRVTRRIRPAAASARDGRWSRSRARWSARARHRPRRPPYVAPAGAQTARLLSRGAVNAGDAYGILVYDDAVNCAGPRIASAGSSLKTPKATDIEAGRTTTLDFLVAHPDKTSCRIRWSFTPAAGKTYLVAGALTTKGCSARLLDATDPDHMKAETSARRRNLGGSACSALV